MTELTAIVAIAVLLLQFGAIVWGAGRLRESLDGLKTSVDKLSSVAEAQDARIDNHELRISLLDQKVEAL